MPKGFFRYGRFVVYVVVLALAVGFYFESRDRAAQPPVQVFRVTPNMITPLAEAGSLNVPRSAVREMLEAAPFDVTFSYAPMDDGRSRYMGRAAGGGTAVELVGPPQDLTHVILYVWLRPENEAMTIRNLTALLRVTDIVTPGWDDAEDWVQRNIERAFSQGFVETTWEGTRIQMSAGDRPGALVLSIAGDPPDLG